MSWGRGGIAAAVVALGAVGVLLIARGRGGGVPFGSADLALPTPSFDPVSAPTVEFSDFVGAEVCEECHEARYHDWAASTHGRAGGVPAPDLLIAPFNGAPIQFADATVLPRGDGEGGYEFVIRQDGYEELRYPVRGVVGGGHMLGGGTQGFFTDWPDGTLRFLPFDWSRAEGRWFCRNRLEVPGQSGWIPLGAELRLAECGDWPPNRVLGAAVDRFSTCRGCHGSQIQVERVRGQGHRTSYTSLRIECESCHGPARKHVEMAEAEAFPADGDIGLPSLTNLPKDASLSVCLTCHGVSSLLAGGYLPGAPPENYFALKYPVLAEDPPYFPDGRIRVFAYQANHLASACYLNGSMDCVSCHDPHTQGYWDVNKRPLASPYDDGQCTACHLSKAQSVETHTFHPPDSEGSVCVNCHMPYLQHPQVGDQIRYARSDHVIPLPRPAFDDSLGITNACSQCHDEPVEELQRQVDDLWGELKPHRPLVQALSEPPPGSLTEAADRFLRPDQTDPLTQVQALGRLLFNWLRADDPGLDSEIVDRLRALAANPDLDVRTLALASLHWTAGSDPEVRRLLVESLEQAAEDGSDEAVRRRWNLALLDLALSFTSRGELGRAENAYRKALSVLPDDPRTLQLLGILYAQGGQSGRALELLQRSADADPRRSEPWVGRGLVLALSGDVGGAERAFRMAIDVDPDDPLAHFQLGDLLQSRNQLDGAIEEFRRVVEIEPGNADAQLALALLLGGLQRLDEALPHARRAVEFRPADPQARQLLEGLQQPQ